MIETIKSYYSTQIELESNPDFFSFPLEHSLELLSQKICDLMGLSYLDVYLFEQDHKTLVKKSSYAAVSGINPPKVLTTEELAFLKKKGSLLVPLYSSGEQRGVVVLERLDPSKDWSDLERYFALNCTDLIARIIENKSDFFYQRNIKSRIDSAEKDLITKLKEIQDSKLELEQALEGAQAGTWDWNIETNELHLSSTWFTRLGYVPNELPPEISTFRKVLHPDDREKTFLSLQKYLRGESELYEPRFRMITKSGEIQWCLSRGHITKRKADGSPLTISGMTININPIIQLQESMARSQDQLETMISSVPTAVAMFDKNLKYMAYSSRWVHDWSPLGLIQIGEEFTSVLGPYGKVWELYMTRAFEGEKLEKAEDLIAVSPEHKLWFRWVCQPWRDADGEIGGVILMAEDISARKEAEMKLSQSAKLSALGEMAGGIAHEINNPMSIIKGYIDLIKRQSARQSLSPELLMKYIDKMDFTVHRISRIVSGMRRFSRESSLDEKQPYSLNKIINETLDFCNERITNFGISLDVEYFKGEGLILCRPVEISQVLLNLINNSFQAISLLPHPWIKIICTERPEHFEIKIVDCGEGIPESSLAKLFQPFFTTKEIGVGTGLGLSISRGIIEEHLGVLKYIEKTPHTTFIIELPKSSMVNN